MRAREGLGAGRSRRSGGDRQETEQEEWEDAEWEEEVQGGSDARASLSIRTGIRPGLPSQVCICAPAPPGVLHPC